jgi:ABC-type branched-subunit amino acid transport system permease subunit
VNYQYIIGPRPKIEGLTLIYIIVAVRFRTISILGQLPLARAAFMGIGAYVAGMTSNYLAGHPGSPFRWGEWQQQVSGLLQLTHLPD